MANIRQTILVRQDLHLPLGLMAAQVAHLHMERMRNLFLEAHTKVPPIPPILNTFPDDEEWMQDPYLFVHGVPNREALHYFMNEAKEKCVITPWSDTIYIDISPTQKKAFENVLVGVTLGPCDSDIIKTIIGDLPLL